MTHENEAPEGDAWGREDPKVTMQSAFDRLFADGQDESVIEAMGPEFREELRRFYRYGVMEFIDLCMDEFEAVTGDAMLARRLFALCSMVGEGMRPAPPPPAAN